MAKQNDNQNKGNKGSQGQDSADRAGQLNESQNQARRQAEIDEEEKKKKEAQEKKDKEGENNEKPNAVNAATSSLLKGAWENLVMSWGLTLIWIDIHVFATLVFGEKLFCKLGMEWVPNALKEKQFEEASRLGKIVGAVEGPGVGCLNLGCLMIVIIFMMIVAMILDVIKNPLSHLTELTGWVWNVGLGTVVKWLSGG